MQYGEAFAKLGYKLDAPRTDWSAEKADGVCITLWRSEIDWNKLEMDSRVHGGSIDDWKHLPGNRKRIRHAARAIREFAGKVDVIVVDGIPGKGVEKATPWNPADRNGFEWQVVSLDEEVGHIALIAR